jgi:hypothetical protein
LWQHSLEPGVPSAESEYEPRVPCSGETDSISGLWILVSWLDGARRLPAKVLFPLFVMKLPNFITPAVLFRL